MGFAHLHVHTEYSLLDGSAKIKKLVARAKELGFTDLAITDHGVMYGAVDFWEACKAEGINPVIGCEVYVAPGSRFEKGDSLSDERYRHLILLAEDNAGYQNLIKIVSIGFTEGFYYKPRVDIETLEKYHEGLICLSACLAGEIPSLIKRGFYDEAREAALRFERIFGKGNFFLELQDHGIPEQKTVNASLLRMSKETGIELVCTNDVHYIREEDWEAHDILLCVQTQRKIADEDRMRYEKGKFYLKSEEEMRELFPYASEACDNTLKIAQRCHVEFEFGHYKLPHFDVPEGFDGETYLRYLAETGLKRRYGEVTEALRERLDYELNIIHTMGFDNYFLIVWDYIRFAKDNGIPVGPGRGSGAGSIVAYSVGITEIDPIKYNLVFERFLNPERVSMPDFDVDFCYERRQEVIDYVVSKYGRDRVCQIVTFGTMKAKNAIRDVARALDMSYADADKVAKLIPADGKSTIQESLSMVKELAEMYETDDRIKYLIDMAMQLEGLPRNTSMHAAGVIISNAPVVDYVPLSCGGDGVVTTQYNMTLCERLGLLKMDFLGLRTLSVIRHAVDNVNKYRTGEKLDISNISYDDKNVYDMISQGSTDAVFQLEGGGMTAFMKQLKPSSLEDVIAGISLYRPGPMSYIPQYVAGKNNIDTVTYDCPQMKPILENTYGVMVYQEQVMQIVRDLAGYSYGRSDLVRRAMSKKKKEVMEKERQYFVYGNPEMNVKGCVGNGISAEIGETIFDKMTDFASYAFNKAHAACYAVVAYQTAFLKYYYPVEYMAAIMTSMMDNRDKITEYIYSCKKLGLTMLPPDVNESEAGFSGQNGCIRYGLAAIKGIGTTVIENLKAEREQNGPFVTFKDFLERGMSLGLNKKAVENLIKAGAVDSLPGTRKQKICVYQIIMDDIASDRKKNIAGQLSLFDIFPTEEMRQSENDFPNVGEYSKNEILSFEKEALDLYLSGHPLEEYMDALNKKCNVSTLDFRQNDDSDEAEAEGSAVSVAEDTDREKKTVTEGMSVSIGGLILSVKKMVTKRNQMMASLTLEDIYGNVEVIVFPKVYERLSQILRADEKIIVSGHVSDDSERGMKIIADHITRLCEVPGKLWLRFNDTAQYESLKTVIEDTMAPYSGPCPVLLYFNDTKEIRQLPRNKSVYFNEDMIRSLKETLGDELVKKTY